MPELQNILEQYGKQYKEKHDLPIYVKKTLNAIEKCRTGELGAHEDICDHCGHKKISYNSCRNRHCPKCQTSAKEKWIYNQKFNVLNVQYFHVVFTVPDILNKVIYYNQTKMYNIMFKAVSETLQELANDKKYLGAQIGFTTILHTWGQNLKDHPHIHCIVPAGGLDSLGKWRNSKKKFFIPVKVLSKVFRGKLIYYMKQEKLDFYKEIEDLKISQEFDKFISSLYARDWIVYCKPPFNILIAFHAFDKDIKEINSTRLVNYIESYNLNEMLEYCKKYNIPIYEEEKIIEMLNEKYPLESWKDNNTKTKKLFW